MDLFGWTCTNCNTSVKAKDMNKHVCGEQDEAQKNPTPFGLLERLVKGLCCVGIHKLDYSDPDKSINDWAICRRCLNTYKVFNRGRWYQTKRFTG